MNKKYIKKREIIERITVIGPMDERNQILEELYNEGWRTDFAGPYTNKSMFPKCDTTRFKLVAEREIKEEVL